MRTGADRESERDRVVMAALPHVAFDGWSAVTLATAGSAAGLSGAETRSLFPGGGADAARHFVAMADRLMVSDLTRRDLGALRLRDKVALAVRLRLERWAPHREAVRRSVPAMVSAGPLSAAAATYRTVDAIWRAVGDRSVDFNFYTKRALLAAVYASTFLYWLDDRSEGSAATWAFLDRRIADVMRVPKIQQGIRERIAKLPDPVRLLRGLRRAFGT
jgi:ubiquinone biosynthesis protein COQ9